MGIFKPPRNNTNMRNQTLAVVTTSTGRFKPGFAANIISGGTRDIFLGPPGHEEKSTIPEFTLEFPDGHRTEFCQYGRDFVFSSTQGAAAA